MPPLIDDPETSSPNAAPFSTNPTSPSPTASISQPHTSYPSSFPSTDDDKGAEETDEEDARLASLITEDADWPAWVPIQEVWMSGGLGSRGEGEDGEDAETEVKGCEEEGEGSEQGRKAEDSQGGESESNELEVGGVRGQGGGRERGVKGSRGVSMMIAERTTGGPGRR